MTYEIGDDIHADGEIMDKWGNKLSDQMILLPSGIVQLFYMQSDSAYGTAKPTADVSVPVVLVGTTATEVAIPYTAPLVSDFDSTTAVKYSVNLEGLTIGQAYRWRPVLRATIGGTPTVLFEIPLADAESFTAIATTYSKIVTVPYALVASTTLPAGTVFSMAFRMVRDTGSDTVTVYLKTNVATGKYVFLQVSGAYTTTDYVYEIVGATPTLQKTINAGFRNDMAGKQATAVASSGTLTVAGWSNLSQTLTLAGVTASNIVILSFTSATLDVALAAKVKYSTQNAGSITFVCTTVPTADIGVLAVIL